MKGTLIIAIIDLKKKNITILNSCKNQFNLIQFNLCNSLFLSVTSSDVAKLLSSTKFCHERFLAISQDLLLHSFWMGKKKTM